MSNELRKVDDIDLTFVYLNKKKYKEQELSKIFKSQHKNCISIIIIGLITLLLYFICALFLFPNNTPEEELESNTYIHETLSPALYTLSSETYIDSRYIDDISYFAHCVVAEAGNQDEYGQRLVIDVILNRCDKYNMSTKDIINMPNQFAVVDNGAINKADVEPYIYELIMQEILQRTNSEVLYFRTNYYHSFGIPVLHHQDHFFSK